MFAPGDWCSRACRAVPTPCAWSSRCVRLRRLLPDPARGLPLRPRAAAGSADDAGYVRRLAARLGVPSSTSAVGARRRRGARRSRPGRASERRRAASRSRGDDGAETDRRGAHARRSGRDGPASRAEPGWGLAGMPAIAPGIGRPWIRPLLEVEARARSRRSAGRSVCDPATRPHERRPSVAAQRDPAATCSPPSSARPAATCARRSPGTGGLPARRRRDSPAAEAVEASRQDRRRSVRRLRVDARRARGVRRSRCPRGSSGRVVSQRCGRSRGREDDDRRGARSRRGRPGRRRDLLERLAGGAGRGVCSRRGPSPERDADRPAEASEGERRGAHARGRHRRYTPGSRGGLRAGHREGPRSPADEIQAKLAEMGERITQDYAGRSLLLVGVLKGAFVVMADLARYIRLPLEFDFMAVSSYGAATKTSGVVRILKDLDHDLEGRRRPDRRGHRRLRPHAQLPAEEPARRRAGARSRSRRCSTRAAFRRCRSRCATSGSRSRPSSWSATGSTSRERYRNLPYVATLKPAAYGGCWEPHGAAARRHVSGRCRRRSLACAGPGGCWLFAACSGGFRRRSDRRLGTVTGASSRRARRVRSRCGIAVPARPWTGTVIRRGPAESGGR